MSMTGRKRRSTRAANRLLAATRLGFSIASVASGAAADGVREIDQTCASTTGCFSGDAPGFPVTIDGSAGRSYRLVTSLVNLDPTASLAIVQIQADDVTLDLNGLELSGCATDPCSIQTTAPLSGVDGTGDGITVRNGRVRAVQHFGIRLLGAQHAVEKLVVGAVGAGQAVQVGPASRVSNVAGSAVVDGPVAVFSAGAGSIIERSRGIALIAPTVIRLGAGALLRETRVEYFTNAFTAYGIGVSADEDVRVERCQIDEVSTGPAIVATTGASLAQNYVRGDIHAGTRSHVQCDLVVHFNAGTSLLLGERSTYRDNVVSGLGAVAPVSGALFLDMGANACNGSIAACP